MQTDLTTSNAAGQSRFLIRRAHLASLGTMMPEGGPYVSLVEMATDAGGAPLLLLSDLAQHTRNLASSAAASLLIDGTADTLDGPRVTLIGYVEKAADEHARARYLAKHPRAAGYAGFGDFAFYRFIAERAHLVAGFGRINWVERPELVLPESTWEGLADAEPAIVDHMNTDHADALALYATELAGAAPGSWRMTGIDPEGFDMADGSQRVRLTFDTLVGSSAEARASLVELVKRARRASPA